MSNTCADTVAALSPQGPDGFVLLRVLVNVLVFMSLLVVRLVLAVFYNNNKQEDETKHARNCKLITVWYEIRSKQ